MVPSVAFHQLRVNGTCFLVYRVCTPLSSLMIVGTSDPTGAGEVALGVSIRRLGRSKCDWKDAAVVDPPPLPAVCLSVS